MTPFRIEAGGVATLASVTGSTNSGDTGATTDRPVSNGAVIGRDAGRGWPIYSFDPFLGRSFPIANDAIRIELRAEAFNALNHRNFVGYSGTYGNGTSAAAGFGASTVGVASQLPARSMQFTAKVAF